MSKLYPSVSGLSIPMAIALALGEWYFFFTEEPGRVGADLRPNWRACGIWRDEARRAAVDSRPPGSASIAPGYAARTSLGVKIPRL
jgi:hypothetical protein